MGLILETRWFSGGFVFAKQSESCRGFLLYDQVLFICFPLLSGSAQSTGPLVALRAVRGRHGKLKLVLQRAHGKECEATCSRLSFLKLEINLRSTFAAINLEWVNLS